MKVLQQTSFFVFGSVCSNIVPVYERKMDGIFELRHSKADREASHGLTVDNFLVFTLYATFFSE